MRWILILFLSWLKLATHAQTVLPSIGGWREHLPYRSLQDIALYNDNTIAAATAYSLFTYNTGDSYIERLSRAGGLSETGIRFIRTTGNNNLLLVYTNNNIDIITPGAIRNIRDIVNSNQVPAAGIYEAWPEESQAYLSSSIGIIVLDINRAEVKETWRIGNAGQPVAVTGFARMGSQYYAATAEGLKSAPVASANLANYVNWTMLSGSNGLPAGACSSVFLFNNRLIARVENRFYFLQNNEWNLFYEDAFNNISYTAQANRLILCQQLNNQFRIQVLDVNGTVVQTLNQAGLLQHPKKAIWLQEEYWIADSVNGLLYYRNGQYNAIVPESPAGVAEGQLFASPVGIMAARGTVKNNTGLNHAGSWFLFNENKWQNFERNPFSALDSCPDIHTVVFNNNTREAWTGSWGGGLQRWQNGNFSRTYKQGFLGEDVLEPQQYKTGGLATDRQGNLWITNPGSSNPLVVRSAADEWIRFSPPYSNVSSFLRDVVSDNNSYKWITAGQAGLLCYSEGNDHSSAADDKWQRYLFAAGQGNLPGTEVTAINVDRNGFIWIGTNNGVAVIECPELVFSSNACEAMRPVIQTGSFAGYLFNNERVLCITTDGANQKWIGTEKGAWLVSPAGDAILEYWHTGNSPLPANRVHSIAIEPVTGEVFFATGSGICSWRGIATAPAGEKPQVHVFPNPVPPGYNGNIGIRGLRENTIVKITELNGRLVYQARSLGGQAVWNGRDYTGRKISTGVYLVLVSDENNQEQAAGKIVFINK